MSPAQPIGYLIQRLDLNADPSEAVMYFAEGLAVPWVADREHADATRYEQKAMALQQKAELFEAREHGFQTFALDPIYPVRTADDEEAEIRPARRAPRVEPSVTFEELERRGLA